MASKSSSGQKSVTKGVHVKYVRRANQWVITYSQNGKNMQEWFSDKPTNEQIEQVKEKQNG